MRDGPALDGGDHLLRRSSTEDQAWGVTGPVTAEKVVQVVLNPDDELRNLQVALLYALSSNRLQDKLTTGASSGPTNANWFTMAQWAVLTVGRNLRTRDVPHRADDLPAALRRRLTPSVLTIRAAADRRVAAALSFGQVMVCASVYHAMLATPFADDRLLPPVDGVDRDETPPPSDVTGPEPADGGTTTIAMASEAARGLEQFAVQMLEERDAEARRSAAEEHARRRTVLRLAAELGADVEGIDSRPEEPSFYVEVLGRLAGCSGHTDELRHAFDLYFLATAVGQARWKAAAWADLPGWLTPADPVRSPADLIFEANLRISAVEQFVLDGAVRMVIEHLPQHVAAQVEGRLATFAERTLRVPRRIAQMNASRRLTRTAAVAQSLWAWAMTDQVLVIALPTETVRLGRDLPRRDWRDPFFPPELATLSAPAQRLYDQFDRSLGDGRAASAGDWRRFDDRMNVVANLLRSRQQDPTLYWQPFTDEDTARIWQGSYPSRIADPFEQALRGQAYPEGLRTGLAAPERVHP